MPQPGTTVLPRIERRLAAIMAADVAHYSQLMGVDEIGTLAALKAHRNERLDPVIARHHGRIVKTTGDGLLVEFASAVDAVACAVAIQEAMLDIQRGHPRRPADRTSHRHQRRRHHHRRQRHLRRWRERCRPAGSLVRAGRRLHLALGQRANPRQAVARPLPTSASRRSRISPVQSAYSGWRRRTSLHSPRRRSHCPRRLIMPKCAATQLSGRQAGGWRGGSGGSSGLRRLVDAARQECAARQRRGGSGHAASSRLFATGPAPIRHRSAVREPQR